MEKLEKKKKKKSVNYTAILILNNSGSTILNYTSIYTLSHQKYKILRRLFLKDREIGQN